MRAKSEMGSGKKMSTYWFDDPSFDDMVEVVDGKTFKGDDWRRLMRLKEESKVQVIPVVGITFRQDALKMAMGGPPSPNLIPEPENEYDPNAIRIEIGGHHVGYVPRGKPLSPDSRAHVCKWGLDPPHVWLAVEC